MRQVDTIHEELLDRAQDVVREASPWLERLGRLGLVAKGIVYATVGALAAGAAFGIGGETTDAQGALERIFLAPFGRIRLAALAGGPFGPWLLGASRPGCWPTASTCWSKRAIAAW